MIFLLHIVADQISLVNSQFENTRKNDKIKNEFQS